MVEVWLGSNLAERMIEVVKCLSGTDMLGDFDMKDLAGHSFNPVPCRDEYGMVNHERAMAESPASWLIDSTMQYGTNYLEQGPSFKRALT